jgi:DNA-binding NtrC family response regulator
VAGNGVKHASQGPEPCGGARLNVITVTLAPLRERREDIPELVQHFLTTRQLGPTPCRIQPDALEALVRHDWPGNVRELANVLERAQILAEGHCITPDDLPEGIAENRPAAGAGPAGDPRHLYEAQQRHVLDVLRQEKGNKVHAARALGISRRALYRLLEKYQREGGVPEKETTTVQGSTPGASGETDPPNS